MKKIAKFVGSLPLWFLSGIGLVLISEGLRQRAYRKGRI